MMHPDTELRFVNDLVGMGVFATAFIPAGTITNAEDPLDIVIYPDNPVLNNPLLRPQIDKYAVVEPGQRRVMSWDLSKFVNHCCQANTMSTGWGLEIALRDIMPGEEIRDEYGLFNLPWTISLTCSQSPCRGCLAHDDFERYAAQWDAQIQAVLRRAMDVPQPLWPLLDGETAVSLRNYINTGQGYRSVTALRVAPVSVP